MTQLINQLSYRKVISQLSTLSTKSFTFNGEEYTPPPSFKVTPSFFRPYGCHLNCGACCQAFTLDYLPEEWEGASQKYPRLLPRVKILDLTINGRVVPIMSIEQPVTEASFSKTPCTQLDQETGACTIHENNPLSCRTELVKITRMRGKGYLLKRPFGRPWAMKNMVTGEKGDVRCTFGEEFDEEQFWENDIPVLTQFLSWADYFGIETHLTELIYQLTQMVQTREISDLELFTEGVTNG